MHMLFSAVDRFARAVIGLIGRVFPRLGALCERIWNNTELIAYLFAGVATTLVNYVVYVLSTRVFGLGLVPANMVAWVLAVAFAYVVNKMLVFHTRCENIPALLREILSFFAMRLFSLGAELVLMTLTVDVLGLNDLIMKLLINLLVIVLNYLFSKLFIFRKDKKPDKAASGADVTAGQETEEKR